VEAKAKAIDQSLRAARFTTAFGRAVLELWRAMRPKAKALGYLEATARAKATAKATATTTANAGILHCVQNDGLLWGRAFLRLE
jgi:hypothetical protein